jgi:hypothetical protein
MKKIIRSLRLNRWLLGGLAAALAWLAIPQTARADALDAALARHGPVILDKLQEKNYKNVGVLHFRVKRGNRGETFYAGAISENLAYRLENALIIAELPSAPVGIIRDASARAAAAGVGRWMRSDQERRRLFSIGNYPLAWGGQKVRADAFLTGVVKVPDDFEQVTVVVEAFSPQSLKPVKIDEFTVPTDRGLLGDLGQSFVVTRRGLSSNARNHMAVAYARRRDAAPPGEELATPGSTAGIRIDVRYDQQVQSIQPDGNSANNFRIPTPTAGQRVDIVLTHTGTPAETLAVLLQVNGRSTWRQQDMDAPMCQLWLLQPGETQVFQGYYMDLQGANLLPFQVLTEEESAVRAPEFGGRAGWIDMYVFRSDGGDPGEPMQISMRGVSRRSLAASPPTTLTELQARLMRSGNMEWRQPTGSSKSGKRGLIVPSVEPIDGGVIGIRGFPKPTEIGHLMIRYYDTAQMSITK